MRASPLRIAVAAVVVVAVLLVALPLLFARTLLEQAATRALGREVSIASGPGLDWGWPVTVVTLGGVAVANAAWAEGPSVARVDTLRTAIDVRTSLDERRLRIRELMLVRPELLLERQADGGLNWPSRAAADADDGAGAGVAVEAVRIDDGTLGYRDRKAGARLTGTFATTDRADAPLELRFRGDGEYNGEPLLVEALASMPLSRAAWGDKGVGISAHLRSGASSLGVEGTLVEPIASSELALRLSGPNPAELYPLVPIPFPDLPPYTLSAKVRLEDERWHLRDLAGTVGDSDLAGHLSVSHAGRLRIAGALRTKYLDFDDLGGLVGAAPDPSETASAEQRARARARAQRKTVFSHEPIDISKLAVADVDLEYRADRVRTKDLPVTRMSMHVRVEQGGLELRDLTFGLADGTLAGHVTMRPQRSGVRTSVDARVDKVHLRDLLKTFDRDFEGAGVVNGRLSVTGGGKSIADIMATSQSQLALYMEGGRLDVMLVELAGLDLGEALVSWLANPKTVAIRCAFVDMAGTDGVIRDRSIVIDTVDTSFIATGAVDFAKEQIRMILVPRAKDFSLLSAESNIYIEGPLKKPKASPRASEALRELLTPIETGAGVADADCARLVGEMARRTK